MSFSATQHELRERIIAKKLHYVFVDPDGSWPSWMGVIVQCATGIVFGHQCGGLETIEYLAEGYYVPLAGIKMNSEECLQPKELVHIFHYNDRCCGASGNLLPGQLEQLQVILSSIPFWSSDIGGRQEKREPLKLDTSRLEQLCEAWIPVITCSGPGILVCKNCD